MNIAGYTAIVVYPAFCFAVQLIVSDCWESDKNTS